MQEKSFFISGGTGSFGSNFVSLLLKRKKNIKKIVIFSRDEVKQLALKKKFIRYQKKLRFLIGDVRDFERVKEAISDCEVVVHTAALKQVDTCEYNPLESIKTNIIGTDNIIKACLSLNVKKSVLISTDKAVNPLNLYGACKLSAEKLFIAANNIKGKKETKFSVIRYGNVSYSRGSVLELFQSLKKKNEKFLPLTHDKMTRFAISIDDATMFVYKCIQMMKSCEVFVPKLKSYKVVDIIKCMGLKYKIIGIRPGEKIHETLISKEEVKKTTSKNSFYIISPNYKKNNLSYKYSEGYSSNIEGNFLNQRELKKIINEKHKV
jgi:UDP-N-acetylglucosamine 4,6-dehydratase/5-epimerase